MCPHPIRQVIESCDSAISAKDFDSLMQHYAEDAALVVKPGMVVKGKNNIRKAFIAIADYFQGELVVEQGEMQLLKVREMLWLLWKRCFISLMSKATVLKQRDVQPTFFARNPMGAGYAPLIILTALLFWIATPEYD